MDGPHRDGCDDPQLKGWYGKGGGNARTGSLDRGILVMQRQRMNFVVRMVGFRTHPIFGVVLLLRLMRPGVHDRLAHRGEVREDRQVSKDVTDAAAERVRASDHNLKVWQTARRCQTPFIGRDPVVLTRF